MSCLVASMPASDLWEASPSALLSEAALVGVEDALTGDVLRTQARLACSEAASGGGSRAASAAAARKMTDVSATEASMDLKKRSPDGVKQNAHAAS